MNPENYFQVVQKILDLVKEVDEAQARIKLSETKTRSKEILIELHEAKKEYEGLRITFYRKVQAILKEAGMIEE